MNLKELKETSLGHRPRRRIGRGAGSGLGKTAGKGHKGRNARAGVGGFIGYEGGQTPLFRRLPKCGFNNVNHRIEYAIVNVGDLSVFSAGTEITPDSLVKSGMLRELKAGLKILGGGDLNVALKVHAHKFSASAAEKIRKAGGETKEL